MKSPLNRGGLRFYLVLIALVRGAASPTSIAWGTPLILIGVALHFWAKGCLRQNQFVAMIGPYRFVRHPFYLANALIDAGIAIMSGWWPLMAVLPIWWPAIYLPVMRKEEDHLVAEFGSVYEDYRRKVARLIPWRRPLPATAEGFSWKNPNIARGEEIPRALRILAYPLLFLACAAIRSERWAFMSDAAIQDALSGLAALYGLAWMLERNQRRGRRIWPQGASHRALRAAVAIGLVVAAYLLGRPIWPKVDAYSLAGGCLIGLSILMMVKRRSIELMAECVALVGIVTLLRAPWLSTLPILVYAAWILDERLPTESEKS